MDLKLITLAIIGVGIKALLIPAYYSTDFDVHYNWLRITSTKSISQWYYDDFSKWTLDYPPFFAYFQYLLSVLGNFIFNLKYTTLQVTSLVIYFQRLTVIATQIPFLYVLYIIFNRKICFELIFSYFFLPFIILDNIHFQYNVMLQTLFLTSVYFLIRKQNYLIAALLYSILLNFKHIYLYCSIAYFFIILKNYVLKKHNKQLQNQNQNALKLIRLLKVGLITILPFIVSFGPFFIMTGSQGIKQIFSRLFPFARGLIHEYWAPNFWALYYFGDKVLSSILKILFSYQPKFSVQNIEVKQLNSLRILPQPSANMTLIIILVVLVPLMIKMCKSNKISALKNILINGLVFFMFGYHVHQKAISPYLHLLYVFIASQRFLNNKNSKGSDNNYQVISQIQEQSEQQKPQFGQIKKLNQKKQNVCCLQQMYCLIFFNIFNLLPLLIDIEQKPLKIITCLFYFLLIEQKSLFKPSKKVGFYSYLNYFCFGMMILCEMIIPFANWIKGSKFQFLHLMINSVVCASVNFIWLIKVYILTIKQKD